MARVLGEKSSTVMAWKRAGRIPAAQQAHVLQTGEAKGLPITAEDVVFPFGRPATDLAPTTVPVACDRGLEAQVSDDQS